MNEELRPTRASLYEELRCYACHDIIGRTSCDISFGETVCANCLDEYDRTPEAFATMTPDEAKMQQRKIRLFIAFGVYFVVWSILMLFK